MSGSWSPWKPIAGPSPGAAAVLVDDDAVAGYDTGTAWPRRAVSMSSKPPEAAGLLTGELRLLLPDPMPVKRDWRLLRTTRGMEGSGSAQIGKNKNWTCQILKYLGPPQISIYAIWKVVTSTAPRRGPQATIPTEARLPWRRVRWRRRACASCGWRHRHRS